jgi:hypothetical protein
VSHFTPNPALDLVLERTIPVPPERVWAARTQPELLMKTAAPTTEQSRCTPTRTPASSTPTWASPKDGELPSTKWSHS